MGRKDLGVLAAFPFGLSQVISWGHGSLLLYNPSGHAGKGFFFFFFNARKESIINTSEGSPNTFLLFQQFKQNSYNNIFNNFSCL